MRQITETHEWIEIHEAIATIGLEQKAVDEIGEIVFVELPKIGAQVKAGDEICVLESTKAAIDLYTPLDGTVVSVNEKLLDDISLLNSDAENEGWLYRLSAGAAASSS